jgi:hypothetical protein
MLAQLAQVIERQDRLEIPGSDLLTHVKRSESCWAGTREPVLVTMEWQGSMRHAQREPM